MASATGLVTRKGKEQRTDPYGFDQHIIYLFIQLRKNPRETNILRLFRPFGVIYDFRRSFKLQYQIDLMESKMFDFKPRVTKKKKKTT